MVAGWFKVSKTSFYFNTIRDSCFTLHKPNYQTCRILRYFPHKCFINVCRLFTFHRFFWAFCLSGFRGGRAFRGEAAVFPSDRGAGRADRRLLPAPPLLRLRGGSLRMGRLAVGPSRLLRGEVISVRMGGVVVEPGRAVCLREAEIAGHWEGAAAHRARCPRVGHVIHRCSFGTFVRLVQAIRALLLYIR